MHKYSKWVILAHWKVVARQQDDICDKDEAAYTLEATRDHKVSDFRRNNSWCNEEGGNQNRLDSTYRRANESEEHR